MQAGDGLEAVTYAARTVAQLVVLEFEMPELDGRAACAQIRPLPGYGDVPIVTLTLSTTRLLAQQRNKLA